MLDFMKNKKHLDEKDDLNAIYNYNSSSDFILLALFIDEDGKKIVSEEQVEALKSYMTEELNKQYREMKSNTIYCILSEQGDSDALLDYYYHYHESDIGYSLTKNISTLTLAQTIAHLFDKRQLNIVLPPGVVNLLLSLLPKEEKTDNKTFQKK